MIPYGLFKTGSSKLHSHNKCGICGEPYFSKRKARSGWKQEVNQMMTDEQWDQLVEIFEVKEYGSTGNNEQSKKDLCGDNDKVGPRDKSD